MGPPSTRAWGGFGGGRQGCTPPRGGPGPSLSPSLCPCAPPCNARSHCVCRGRGGLLDNVEQHVLHAAEHVEQARQQTKKALQYQGQARKTLPTIPAATSPSGTLPSTAAWPPPLPDPLPSPAVFRLPPWTPAWHHCPPPAPPPPRHRSPLLHQTIPCDPASPWDLPLVLMSPAGTGLFILLLLINELLPAPQILLGGARGPHQHHRDVATGATAPARGDEVPRSEQARAGPSPARGQGTWSGEGVFGGTSSRQRVWPRFAAHCVTAD
ncbi:syntaxin-3 isoform X6 [Strix uralensis]|uniref:syntaxin-3 isoform X6 n=1 Tax=Strix uralensis TaxID=36305 RepID=UPI003DA32677